MPALKRLRRVLSRAMWWGWSAWQFLRRQFLPSAIKTRIVLISAPTGYFLRVCLKCFLGDEMDGVLTCVGHYTCVFKVDKKRLLVKDSPPLRRHL